MSSPVSSRASHANRWQRAEAVGLSFSPRCGAMRANRNGTGSSFPWMKNMSRSSSVRIPICVTLDSPSIEISWGPMATDGNFDTSEVSTDERHASWIMRTCAMCASISSSCCMESRSRISMSSARSASSTASLRRCAFSRRMEHSWVCASITGLSFSSVSVSSSAASTPPISCCSVIVMGAPLLTISSVTWTPMICARTGPGSICPDIAWKRLVTSSMFPLHAAWKDCSASSSFVIVMLGSTIL
mmetsp:Transcript_4275/g.10294  ORF Transcript_4275/g.10294 Transcript_4275/m.10294 type:complete len:244 (-) Transcript_4275:51-782(-)